MHSELDRAEYEAYVLPIPTLGRTALLSGAFSLVPVFIALLWLTVATEIWPVVALAEIVVTGVFVAIYLRFRRVFAAVTRSGFVKRGLLPPFTAVDRSRIDRVLVNLVYRSYSIESLTQLVALDANGRRLFRLNGVFWPDEGISAVADALGIKTTVDKVPLSRRDYYRRFPMAQAWYERRRVTLITLVVVLVVVVPLLLTIENLARPA